MEFLSCKLHFNAVFIALTWWKMTVYNASICFKSGLRYAWSCLNMRMVLPRIALACLGLPCPASDCLVLPRYACFCLGMPCHAWLPESSSFSRVLRSVRKAQKCVLWEVPLRFIFAKRSLRFFLRFFIIVCAFSALFFKYAKMTQKAYNITNNTSLLVNFFVGERTFWYVYLAISIVQFS